MIAKGEWKKRLYDNTIIHNVRWQCITSEAADPLREFLILKIVFGEIHSSDEGQDTSRRHDQESKSWLKSQFKTTTPESRTFSFSFSANDSFISLFKAHSLDSETVPSIQSLKREGPKKKTFFSTWKQVFINFFF